MVDGGGGGGGGLCSAAQFCMGCDTKYHSVTLGGGGGEGSKKELTIF